ncbi:hypothetical protein H5410_022564 [Solanum commersonii]|uniref:Secreted protein n=1 Tax=Solanum commersonii TaxID=4109 RepID=A0A9J5ZED1_SOLCO|nr:hypothetical protein H5410_022564 [Solanum commersonii]
MIRPLLWFIAFQLLPSASSHFESLGDIMLLRRTIRAQNTRTLGETKAIRRLTQWFKRFSGLLFFALSAALFLFLHSVHVLSLSSNT